MKDLKYYQKVIQDKRKQTDFRDFLMEIGSWYSMVLYRDEDGLSRYPITDRIGNLSSIAEFEENRSELTKKSLDYDTQTSFFDNFQKLFLSVDQQRILARNSENCDYVDDVISSKDSYLSFMVITDCSNVLYSFLVKENCHNIINSLNITENCSNIFMSNASMNSHNIFYSANIVNSSDTWFSSNLMTCSECIFCDNLEGKKYHIENIGYSREEYKKKKQEILKDKHQFDSYKNQLNKKLNNFGSTNVTGNSILHGDNVENGNYLYRVHGGRNLVMVGGSQGNHNIYDAVCAGGYKAEDMYGVMISGINVSDVYCSYAMIGEGSNILYSYGLDVCSYCIGCIGLQNKSYCILNKQYSKEDWHIMADKIFSEMESAGTLGEYFSPEINPFYFNDTMAGILGSYTKQEVIQKGYMWRDEKIKVDIPEGSAVIKTSELEDYQGYNKSGEWRINSEILKKVIVDERGDYYRIVQMEYDFLVKHNLPLPETHWMDRIKLNFGM